jgi:hypothetical protein
VLLAPVSKKVVSDTRDAQGMTRLNRQTSSLDDWDGNSFPYMVENVIESTPFFAEGFHQAGQAVGGNLGTDGKFTEAESQYSKVNFPSVPKFPCLSLVIERETPHQFLKRFARHGPQLFGMRT